MCSSDLCEVSITGFTAAIAGSEDNTEGMDGAFTFTVSLSKGENDTLAEATATGINGAITAASYSAQEYLVSVSASPAAGGIVSGGGTYAENTSAVVTAAAKAGYHFVRWTEGGSEVSTSKSYTFTIIGNRILVAVFEKNGGSGGSSGGGGSSSGGSSGGGGSSSGGSSGGGGNSYNDKPKIPAVGQTEPIMPDAGGNAKVDNGAVQSAVSAVKNDAGRDGDLANGVAVTIPVTPGAGQASWNVAITGQTLDTLVREDVKRLEIVIEGMIIEGINADLLKWLNTVSTGGDIILRIKRTDLPGSSEARSAIGTRPAYNLSMVYLSDGKETQIDDFGGHTISIRLPYIPAKGEQAGSLYAVCVDGAGKVDWIINSSYHPDLGAVIFETGHFSVYGVACKDDVPAFTDIADHWAADNIIVCILGLKPSPSRRNL